jgi:endonuclease/exonuclease/phosphatase family metal-dependent hydrolase
VPVHLRVATYNLHAGVDGWGRPTGVVDAAVALDADVLFVQESWRSRDVDLAQEIATRTGATARTYALASGWRVTDGAGPASWQPRDSLLVGNRGLYLDSQHALSPRAARRLAAARGAERGEWCIGIVTRLDVLDEDVVELVHLAPDRARRRLAHLTLAHERGPIEAFGLHGAHLSHGSIGQYRELARDLDERVVAGAPALLAGDLNCWGPVARRVLRGWRQAAHGPSWPSWRPHSQLDHVFVRGPVAALGGGPVDARASDHRPVLATVSIGEPPAR